MIPERYRLNYSAITRALYQGSAPFPDDVRDLRKAGIGVIVLCAQEYQPAAIEFAPLTVIHAPMDDDRADCQTVETANNASRFVAEHLRAGRSVLVTCAQGRNRSGLVTAFSLYRTTSLEGSTILRLIQARRKNALTNQEFAQHIASLRRLDYHNPPVPQ